MKRLFLSARRVIYDAIGHFDLADGWALASHVALSSLLALFPFLIFATTLATFLGADEYADSAVQLVFEIWPESIATPIAREVANVLTVPRGGLLTISVIAAAFFASNGVEALRIALNRAYRVKETRNFLLLRAQSLVFVVLATASLLTVSFLLIFAPLLINFAEEIVHWVPGFSEFRAPSNLLRIAIAIILLAIGLFVVHKWLPAGARDSKSLLPGIAFTIICWGAGASLFAMYLENFGTYATTYAGLASIMIALVFLYIIAAIFILGAELNAAIFQFQKARAGIRSISKIK